MRIIRFNPRDNTCLGDVKDTKIISATLHEEINGEHSLTLVTTQMLDKGERLVFYFNEKWQEYVVAGVNEEHTIGSTTINTYYCVWSLQEDLSCFLVSIMPGLNSPVSASNAVTALLSTQTRWNVGTIDTLRNAGASMYDRSAWDALSTLIETWGGEASVTIEVDDSSVTNRLLNIRSHLGSSTPKYRFDFGRDVASVKRSYSDSPNYSRISPRGKGDATENGGYGRKITIADAWYGRDWLEHNFAASYRLKNPDGTYISPTVKVENSKCETPAQLLSWAQSILNNYLLPEVVYTIDTVNYADTQGTAYDTLELGDVVQVHDGRFGYTSNLGQLKFESRIVAVEWNLLNGSKTMMQISSSKKSIASKFSSLGGSGGTNYSNPSVSSAIGGVEPVTTSGIEVPSGTNTNVCTLSLPAGVWMLCGQVAFPVNATGRRAAKISTTSGDSANVISTVVQDAVSGALTRCSTSRCLSFATQTPVYLIGYQTSGETLSCSGQFEATRLA